MARDDVELVAGGAVLLVLTGGNHARQPPAYKAVVDAMPWPRRDRGVLVVACAAARFGGVLADNLRNVLFEKVGQNAARRL